MPKISELPAGAALNGTETLPVVQGASTVRTTVSAVAGAIPGGTFAQTPAPGVATRLSVVDLKAQGGDATGATSSTTAFNAAKAALSGTGIIDLGPGIFAFGDSVITPGTGNKIRGAGLATTIKGISAPNAIIYVGGQSDFELSDFIMDGTGCGQPILLDSCRNFSLRRLRMATPNSSYSITLNKCSDFTIEDVDGYWSAATNTPPTFIYMNGCNRGKIIRPKYSTHVLAGITILASSNITITDPDMDAQWFYLPSRYNNYVNVTYTATTLTDPNGAFSTASPAISVGSTVRAMPVKTTGLTATTTYEANRIINTNTTFVSSGVVEGDIVTVGTVWTMVERAASETVLTIDGWKLLSNNFPAPTPAPAGYAIYKLILGRFQSSTGTTLTVDEWRDLNGTITLPPAGTYYEVSYNKGGHPILADGDCRNIKVSGGRVRRGWGDQFNIQGNFSTVSGVTVEFGQDIGIGIEGGYGSTVIGNTLHRNGSMGVWAPDDANVADNIFVDNGWNAGDLRLGMVHLVGSRASVHGNRFINRAMTLSKFPVVVQSGSGVGDGNVIGPNNVATGYAKTLVGLWPSATNITNTVVAETSQVTNVAGTGTVTGTKQRPVDARSGTGSPETVVTAPVGTLYLRTDGGASTTLYIKETGTAATGWRAV